MSRTLPPRPDFTQLRHQAKDLLRAHERSDAGVCGVLRRLRRFASADDSAILARPLALHEAQYALAMDYGFASWNALKRYVEKVTGRPSPVRRERNRTYVTGLEAHGIGCKDEHDNSVIACIAGVMAALGEHFSYPYLLGASGAAFRVQMRHPGWCPSAACAPCGYDCVPGAMAVTGYRLNWIDTRRDGKWLPDGLKQALETVPASVDRGVPVIISDKESGLIVGYRDDGRLIVRPYEHRQDGYTDPELLAPAGAAPESLADTPADGDWAWGVGIVEPADVPMDRSEAVADSLRLAVKLARTERFGDYLSGFVAMEHWAADLLDDARFDALTDDNWFPVAHANGYCYPSLWSARLNAERYLGEVASEFAEPVRSRLSELAGLYGRMHRTLARTRPEFNCVWSLQPWELKSPANWTREIRAKESQLLREMLAIEREAVAKVEALLPLLAPPAGEA